MSKLASYVRERVRAVDAPPAEMPGGASFAYVFGAVLTFLLAMQAVTGIALAAFYSPSSTDAWASVAYIQDRAAGGWLVRGMHYHGASALVVVAGLHLVQTAVAGAYKRPRELVWWLGVLLLVLLLAWSLTGYVLRWDQAGYWANRVELGIVAGTPVVGELLASLLLGGNDYGNLTLTRFYTLHVLVLPALVVVLVIAHIAIARRHGPTPVGALGRSAAPRFPEQTVRDAVAMAATLAILLGYVVSQGGADLAAPADPSQPYDARPLWYFRWLFELRELAGALEQLVALAVPAVVAGFLVALPLLDRGPSRAIKPRLPWLGALAGLFAIIGALSVMSLARDLGDEELAKRERLADTRAHQARALAAEYGVPATGARDVWAMQPMYRARVLFADHCASCHDADSSDRLGPVIAPGHLSRAWISAFLKDPSNAKFYGRTKLVRETPDLAMKPVDMKNPDFDDLVELLYAQTGAEDASAAKAERGKLVFESACTDCHSLEEGVSSSSGPNLAGLGSRAHYFSYISNPKSGLHLGVDQSEMPRFDGDLSVADRDALAEYLVWLRSATAADLARLGPVD